MEALTGYHKQFCELANEIIDHGFGKIQIQVSSLKNGAIKITLEAGKMYVFFIQKEIRFEDRNIL